MPGWSATAVEFPFAPFLVASPKRHFYGLPSNGLVTHNYRPLIRSAVLEMDSKTVVTISETQICAIRVGFAELLKKALFASRMVSGNPPRRLPQALRTKISDRMEAS